MTTVSPTYSPDNPYYQKVQDVRSAVGDNPEAIRQSIGKELLQDPQLQAGISGQTQNIDAMQQIADYDRQLASQVTAGNQQKMQETSALQSQLAQYGSAGATPQETIAKAQAPLPETPMAAPVDGFLSPFVASGLASGQQGAYSDMYDLASQQRGSRERILGNELNNYMQLFAHMLEKEEMDRQRAEQEARYGDALKQQDFENALAIAKLTGQTSFTDPRTGQVYQVQGGEDPTAMKTVEAWNNILAGSSNEYDVWKQIDRGQDALRAAGVNVDELWKWHKNLAERGGPIAASGLGQEEMAELLKERKARVEQGLSTADIDQRLAASGVTPDTSEKNNLVGLIDELLGRKTDVVTGKTRVTDKSWLGWMRPEAQTTLAKFNQLMDSLTVEARQKLKGQGQISDKESEMLARAQSTLKNMGQSDEAIRAELLKIKNILTGDAYSQYRQNLKPGEALYVNTKTGDIGVESETAKLSKEWRRV